MDYREAQNLDIQTNILSETQETNLIALLKPEFAMDGNMYCFTYPSIKGLPNNCIQGFGETAHKASLDFIQNWYNEKAGKKAKA